MKQRCVETLSEEEEEEEEEERLWHFQKNEKTKKKRMKGRRGGEEHSGPLLLLLLLLLRSFVRFSLASSSSSSSPPIKTLWTFGKKKRKAKAVSTRPFRVWSLFCETLNIKDVKQKENRFFLKVSLSSSIITLDFDAPQFTPQKERREHDKSPDEEECRCVDRAFSGAERDRETDLIERVVVVQRKSSLFLPPPLRTTL